MQPVPSERSQLPWPQGLTRIPASALAVVVALLALAVVYVELPGRPLILHSVQKLGHPIVFGCLTVALFAMRRRRSPAGGIWFDYFPTFVLALLFGFGTELSQVVTHRDPAMRDVMLDVRGIVCALALLLSFDPRLGTQRWSAYVRSGLRALVVLLVLGTFAPIAWVTSAYISRAITAPTLFAPRSDLDLLLVSLTDTAPELAKLPAPFSRFADEKGLRVPLTSRPYAGVSLDEPIGDWRRYRTLQIDLTNPTRSELQLHLRIQDRLHNGEVTDRFEAIERLSPGTRRTVEVPLERVATGPRDRRLDLGQVTGVFLYKAGAEGAREMWLGRMSLQ